MATMYSSPIISTDVLNPHTDSTEQRKNIGYVIPVLLFVSSEGAASVARPGHYKATLTHTHTHSQLIHKRSPVSINVTSEPSGVRPSKVLLLIHLLQTAHIFTLSQACGVSCKTSCTLSKQISRAAEQNLL